MAWGSFERALQPIDDDRMANNLSCWESTNPYNEDTYLFVAPEYWRVIRYEHGKIFVARDRHL